VTELSLLERLSGSLRDSLRRGARSGEGEEKPLSIELSKARALYLRARIVARTGNIPLAASMFADAAALDPEFADALEAEGAMLDLTGQEDLARARYDAARLSRARNRPGPPDRPFYARQRGPYVSEIISYSSARQSLRRNVLPLIARGNAYLAQGDAGRALADYDRALKLRPGLPELLALKAEALVALGRHQDALELLDEVLAARPRDAGALNTRGIVNMALGKIAEANADWRLQLEIAGGRPAVCAYLALRLADYEAALPHLEAASQADPRDPYFRLYLNAARMRLGRPSLGGAPVTEEGWPGVLLALQAGSVGDDAVLAQADTIGRRAEALFQMAILKAATDPAAARSRWQEVVEQGPHDLVEYAAARNELARSS
jgi:tetratricopeptide (TPR) repeat protein